MTAISLSARKGLCIDYFKAILSVPWGQLASMFFVWGRGSTILMLGGNRVVFEGVFRFGFILWRMEKVRTEGIVGVWVRRGFMGGWVDA